jgi:hypothetical protein
MAFVQVPSTRDCSSLIRAKKKKKRTIKPSCRLRLMVPNLVFRLKNRNFLSVPVPYFWSG